jgi:hypothetical protein
LFNAILILANILSVPCMPCQQQKACPLWANASYCGGLKPWGDWSGLPELRINGGILIIGAFAMGRFNIIAMFLERYPEDYHPVKVYYGGFPPTYPFSL